jgi:hypothetical protein
VEDTIAGLGITVEEYADAWTYVFARFLVIRQEHLDLSEDGVTYNVIKHNPPVLTGAASGTAPTFVNPNLDVVYSEAWIAVDADTPAVLTVPEIPPGTYYTAQIVDEWAEITYNINERTLPQQPHGSYALCLAGSTPEIPDGALRLDIPSGKAKLLARVEIGDDVDAAVRLQHGFSIRSTGTPAVEPAIDIPMFTNTGPPPVTTLFGRPRLEQALAAPDRSGLAEKFGPVLDAIADHVADPARAAELDEITRTTVFPGFLHYLVTLGTAVDGWSTTGDRTEFGADYHFRTAANFGGIWWNAATEVIYFIGQSDRDGTPLTGDHLHALRFAPGDTPQDHVTGYWSITALSHPDSRLIPNPADRYSLSRHSGLSPDTDGGLTIYIGPERSEGAPEANWLPSTGPGRPYALILRMYLPADDVLDGTWHPPGLTATP